MAEQAGLGADTIVAKNQRYVIFPWTRQSAVKPLHIKTARGCYLYDADGRRTSTCRASSSTSTSVTSIPEWWRRSSARPTSGATRRRRTSAADGEP